MRGNAAPVSSITSHSPHSLIRSGGGVAPGAAKVTQARASPICMNPIRPQSAALIDERIPWLDAVMEGALTSASRDLDLYQWSRYHLGWNDETLTPMSEAERRRHGGKRLRGVLTVLAAEAMGGDGRAAAPGGAAIELIHNFSLVHDDVEDNDEERRHRRTVWKLWGVPQAINVGSNMQAMVDMAVLRLRSAYPAETVVRIFECVTRAVVLMTEGQYLDMAAEDAHEMSLEEYFRMTGGKTAALLEGALRVGAILGSADESRLEAMAAFGRGFGLAFQCRDDFLGIWGEPSLTGKPVGSDILQGKRSLPVVHALSAAPAESLAGKRLRHSLRERDVPSVLALFASLGTAEFVNQRVEEHTAASLSGLERAKAASPYGEAIRDIAEYALGRES
jgi:geranylgeranyl diphosphate synthase, type I